MSWVGRGWGCDLEHGWDGLGVWVVFELGGDGLVCVCMLAWWGWVGMCVHVRWVGMCVHVRCWRLLVARWSVSCLVIHWMASWVAYRLAVHVHVVPRQLAWWLGPGMVWEAVQLFGQVGWGFGLGVGLRVGRQSVRVSALVSHHGIWSVHGCWFAAHLSELG